MILSIEGSDEFVASSAASIATGQATLPRRDFHPLEIHTHSRRTDITDFGKLRRKNEWVSHSPAPDDQQALNKHGSFLSPASDRGE